MKPLGWLILIAPCILTLLGYAMLPRLIKRKSIQDLMGIYSFLLSLLTGVVVGYIVVFPAGALVFFIFPNEPHNGHIGMALGQFFLTVGLTIVVGLVAAIVAFVKIARWRKRKTALASVKKTLTIII